MTDHADGNGPSAAAPADGLPARARVAIVGSGFAGLCIGIRLKHEGVDDFVILEKAGDLGGTWRDNTYPGCRCDVPSHLYSFSFEPNPEWSSTFSPQPEIWDYMRRCAHKHGVVPHIRFGHELVEAAWDEDRRVWRVETSGGTLEADVLVSAMGGLHEPFVPALPGLDSFEGRTFHSSAWDHEHDLGGKSVAAIGTGASAIQFIPQIQPRAARLHVFQRTPPWVLPRPDRPLTDVERRLYRRLPAAQRLMRAGIYWARESLVLAFLRPRLMKLNELMARRHLRRQVPDPALRAKLTPSYTIGCKRILISDDYYPSLTRPNVEVVTDGIRELRPHSIVTADGTEREVDTIVFGTGFRVTDFPAAERLRGRDGRLLSEIWGGSPRAYLGTTVAGFPNLFTLFGPNTGLGHTSVIVMLEAQVDYVLDCLRFMERRGVGTVEVTAAAQAAFNEEVQQRMEGTVWTSGGCDSWYLDATGRNTTLWPDFTFRYRERTRRFDPTDYALRPRVPEPEPVPA